VQADGLIAGGGWKFSVASFKIFLASRNFEVEKRTKFTNKTLDKNIRKTQFYVSKIFKSQVSIFASRRRRRLRNVKIFVSIGGGSAARFDC
jgi:hypothetical protein